MTALPILASGLAGVVLSVTLAWLARKVSAAGSQTTHASRKIFHAGIFSGAAPAYLLTGFWGTVAYGCGVTLLVLRGVRKGPGDSLFRALAREGDGPDSGRFLILPLFSTALGGLLGAVAVGEFVVVGFLVCGWGDALGELVGVKWGRHRYRVPFGRGRGHTRSLEGSISVFLAGALGGSIALAFLGIGFQEVVQVGLICGLVGAVVEAVSSHGTDNLFMQLGATLTAWWFLG